MQQARTHRRVHLRQLAPAANVSSPFSPPRPKKQSSAKLFTSSPISALSLLTPIFVLHRHHQWNWLTSRLTRLEAQLAELVTAAPCHECYEKGLECDRNLVSSRRLPSLHAPDHRFCSSLFPIAVQLVHSTQDAQMHLPSQQEVSALPS
jgi:hypothetical protein